MIMLIIWIMLSYSDRVRNVINTNVNFLSVKSYKTIYAYASLQSLLGSSRPASINVVSDRWAAMRIINTGLLQPLTVAQA